ncbi:MAG: transporter substrate-binding domain-containing protein, partial [Anaerolineales bacterium]|nr:transporter substrate-binding domain-containing protein [Anaerolineales bacterium]
FWLNGDIEGLGLPESSIYASAPAGIKVVPLPTDQECAQAIEAGRRDFVAYVTSETVVDANIAAGIPVVKLDGAVFSEDLAAAFDKSGSLDNTSLVEAVSAAITAMHNDGRLTELSNKWFGVDITKVP